MIDDANGNEIRRIPIADGTTATSLQWDGKDASGNPVPAGSYKMSVDNGTGTGTTDAQWTGKVEAVELTANGPQLRMGDVLISPSDVRSIGQNTTTAAASTTALTRNLISALTGQQGLKS